MSATDEGRVLNVGLVYQLTQVWCWAATSEMVLRYYNLRGTQCEMASFWLNSPCCPFGNGVATCYNAAPSLNAITDVLALGGVRSTVVNRPLTFEEVVQQIRNGSPIIIGYLGSFAGHVVVLFGYDNRGNVYIHDPVYGSFIVPYAVSGLYNGAQTWFGTVVDITRF